MADVLEAPRCCELDEPYQAPPGYYDQPFSYVYDGSELTNGVDARPSVTTLSGADFILRRVAGHDRVAVEAQFYDQMRRTFFHRKAKTAGFGEFVTVPEILYAGASDIVFNLYTVAKTLNSCGSDISQIIFQGVRRFKGYKRPPSYPYWEDEFSYNEDVTVDVADWGTIGQTRRFGIRVFNYDFELLEIKSTILNPNGGGVPIAPGGTNQLFKIQLYDQVYEPIFSKPVVDDLIVSNSTTYQGISPVPGILYRIGQMIQYDLTLLCVPGVCPYQVQLCFHGVRRRPC